MLYGPNRSTIYSTVSLPFAFVQAGAMPTTPGRAFSTAGLFAAGSAPSPAELASWLPSISAILFSPQVVILHVKIAPGSVKGTLVPATVYHKETPPPPRCTRLPPGHSREHVPLSAPHKFPKLPSPLLGTSQPSSPLLVALVAQHWGLAAIQWLLQ